jgi:hypothetical protein
MSSTLLGYDWTWARKANRIDRVNRIKAQLFGNRDFLLERFNPLPRGHS